MKTLFSKITLSPLGWLVAACILLFCWREVLTLAAILIGGWLLHRHREEILNFLEKLFGK